MPGKHALYRGLRLSGSLLLAVFAGACQVREGEVVSEGDYLVFEALGRGQTGLVADSTERVFRSAAAWEAFRDSLSTFAPFPEVDFEQAMVLVMALPQEIGGFGVETVAVELTTDEVVVEYVVTKPASDCIPVVGTSLPFEVVAVRRADGPVRFERRVESYRCTWKQ
jgi:hypothetical protein